MLTKPTYLDCLGVNARGDPMYTLGRMSFEMFRPGDLVLSVDAVFNPVTKAIGRGPRKEDDKDGRRKGGRRGFLMPKNLQEEVCRMMEDGGAAEEEGAEEAEDKHMALITYE